ncbi:sodium-coupled neutral amino acid transporter 3 isoform X1 [Alosa sapidissima]|uniref:sodium-coupled neutral amino acid transporter 3 isoform X1 n=1 Tax=Alosa sapidissima TaxID=34773 RepID=UPI001C09E90C|nr:sodium-coupled neutral amino acid transporter 3 isoform X1 [Alosa sapidissima]XP_041945385.1 sodium-coupled neutral amino acid transporter 3 isoform X1 [Alosa sapidissima]XP_041945386.1 sodium-coupled neutral amino acid transporter 3 isoform X1 [Alosa sapidissima]
MEPAQSEMSILPNGKSHDLAEDMCVPVKTLLEKEHCHDGSFPPLPAALSNGTHSSRFDDPEGATAESEEFLPNGDGKKPVRFTDFEGKTSFGMSVFNLGNAIMGSGILGLAYAMANTGILLFLFLLTAVALLSLYSVHLLLKSAGVVGIRAYEQLGQRAFGTPGKMAAGIAITLQNIGAMSSYLYIVKSEFPLVIQAFLKAEDTSTEWYLNGNYLVVLVTICIILPLAFMKQLGYLGYTSGFSLSCMVFFLTAVIYKKFQIPCPFEDYTSNATNVHVISNVSLVDHGHAYHNAHVEDDSHCGPRLFTINSQTAYTIPILAFAFVCHPEVLPIYTELRNPTQKKMQHVSNISILIMYTMYFLAALFGYLTFYDKVEPELLHTYSRIDPFDTLILCVRLAVLTAVTLTVPIVLFPVRRAIQQMVFPTSAFNWLRHIGIALILLTFINMLVIFAPNILGIFGIIGATSAPCLIFIFPAVFYIRIIPKDKEPMNSTPKIVAMAFAALGVLFMSMSLSFIIIDWTTGTSNAGGGH